MPGESRVARVGTFIRNWKIALAVVVPLAVTIIGSTIAASVYHCNLKLGAGGLAVECNSPEHEE